MILLGLIAACGDGQRAVLSVPQDAHALVLAELDGAEVHRVTGFDLTDLPLKQSGTDYRTLAFFYDRSPSALAIPVGPIVAATVPPLGAFPAAIDDAFELDADAALWRSIPPALPEALASLRFASAACHTIELEAAPLSMGLSVVATLGIDERRALVVRRIRGGNQLAIITATSATERPDLAVDGVPTAALVDDGAIYLVTSGSLGTGELMALWKGTLDRGFERVSTSTVVSIDVFEFLVMDHDVTPPRLYGRTISSSLLELGAEWRVVWVGGGGDLHPGGAVYTPGDGIRVTARAPERQRVMLHVVNGVVDVEGLPTPDVPGAMARATGTVWLGIGIGSVFRRVANTWERRDLLGPFEARAFVDLGDSVVIGTAAGLIVELLPEAGYCEPVRINRAGVVHHATRFGSTLVMAVEQPGEEEVVLRAAVR